MRHFSRIIYEKSLLDGNPHVDEGIPVRKIFPSSSIPQICWTKLRRARSEVEKTDRADGDQQQSWTIWTSVALMKIRRPSMKWCATLPTVTPPWWSWWSSKWSPNRFLSMGCYAAGLDPGYRVKRLFLPFGLLPVRMNSGFWKLSSSNQFKPSGSRAYLDSARPSTDRPTGFL